MNKRVLIVDDHPLVRKGIRETVDELPGFEVVAEAADGAEALAKLDTLPVDLVVLDLSLPKVSGLEVLERARGLHPHLPILVLTMHAEEQYAMRVFKMGAAGYLPKDSSPELLAEAIAKVAGGGRFVTPALAEKLLFLFDQAERPRHESLSHREFQIFQALAIGRSPKSIADDLEISIKTISTYRGRIFAKMGFQTMADLIRYALDHKLIPRNT
jgi:two-component system, NarL family, invasion response regulator UvrY